MRNKIWFAIATVLVAIIVIRLRLRVRAAPDPPRPATDAMRWSPPPPRPALPDIRDARGYVVVEDRTDLVVEEPPRPVPPHPGVAPAFNPGGVDGDRPPRR